MWLNFDILNQFGRNVVVPANKAPKNIVFAWKKILLWVASYRTVHFEERNSCKLICKNTSFYKEEIWSLLTSINILINEGSNDMSILKKKIHKNPYRVYCLLLVQQKNCLWLYRWQRTTTILWTSLLTECHSTWIDFVTEWMLQNSLEDFLEIFFSFPKEITHLNDFSTLCTTIPHENLKPV
jgi:hypothetical protein